MGATTTKECGVNYQLLAWAPRIARCKSGPQSQGLLQQLGRERATIGMPGQLTACAATQGNILVFYDMLVDNYHFDVCHYYEDMHFVNDMHFVIV